MQNVGQLFSVQMVFFVQAWGRKDYQELAGAHRDTPQCSRRFMASSPPKREEMSN